MYKPHTGNASTEYGTILALVVILSIAAITMLGRSTNGLLGTSATGMGSQQVKNLVTMNFRGSGGSMAKSAGGKSSTSPLPSAPKMTSNSGTGSNATSTDGSKSYLNTMTLAERLAAVLPNISDPVTLNWAKKITQKVYYLGGTEGAFEGNPTLTPQGYTRASALTDIYQFRQELVTLLQNPPKGANPADIQLVATLANDANIQAKKYVTQIQPYLNSNGTVNEKALKKTSLNNYKPPLGISFLGILKPAKSLVSYASDPTLGNYQILQANADKVLAEGSANKTPNVKTTLEDAKALKKAGKGSNPPSKPAK